MNKQILKDRLNELEIKPKKSLGQNFLVNESVIEKILNEVTKNRKSQMIEIGPGVGALTDHLVNLSDDFKVIEMDNKLIDYWRSRSVEVIEGDALKIEWNGLLQDKDTLLVSNLPYQIAASVIIDCSLKHFAISHMVLMMQKEVAQRVTASVNTKDYGLISVLAQNFWKIQKIVDVSPSSFYPAPKVNSRVLRFIRIESDLQSPLRFLTFVKSAFAQRRKLLIKNLTSQIKPEDGGKERILASLADLGYSEKVRAEDISPPNFKVLFKSLGLD